MAKPRLPFFKNISQKIICTTFARTSAADERLTPSRLARTRHITTQPNWFFGQQTTWVVIISGWQRREPTAKKTRILVFVLSPEAACAARNQQKAKQKGDFMGGVLLAVFRGNLNFLGIKCVLPTLNLFPFILLKHPGGFQCRFYKVGSIKKMKFFRG